MPYNKLTVFSSLLVLGPVVLEHLLEQIDALLGLDLVDLDKIVGRGQLEVLAFLIHLVGDLARGQLRTMQALRTDKREY